jgi:hypothetical protein
MEQVGVLITEELTESELQMLYEQEAKEYYDTYYPDDDFLGR